MKKNWTIALAAACFTLGAGAQTTIYRCGNAYGTQPCAGATTVDAVPPAKPADIEASRRETEREMKVATAMEKARIAEEAKAPAASIPKQKTEAPADDDRIVAAKMKKPQKPQRPMKAKNAQKAKTAKKAAA